jgi:hypothetical protein
MTGFVPYVQTCPENSFFVFRTACIIRTPIPYTPRGLPHMSRTFIYARVSTADQTTDNQIREIQA